MGGAPSPSDASDRAHVSSSTLASASAPPRRLNATMTTQWTTTTRFSSRSIETPSSMPAARATRRASSTTRVILTVLHTSRTVGSSSRRPETFNQGPSSPMITATSEMGGARQHGRSSTPAAAERATVEEPCSARIGGAAQRITDDGNGETGCRTKQDGLSLAKGHGSPAARRSRCRLPENVPFVMPSPLPARSASSAGQSDSLASSACRLLPHAASAVSIGGPRGGPGYPWAAPARRRGWTRRSPSGSGTCRSSRGRPCGRRRSRQTAPRRTPPGRSPGRAASRPCRVLDHAAAARRPWPCAWPGDPSARRSATRTRRGRRGRCPCGHPAYVRGKHQDVR